MTRNLFLITRRNLFFFIVVELLCKYNDEYLCKKYSASFATSFIQIGLKMSDLLQISDSACISVLFTTRI